MQTEDDQDQGINFCGSRCPATCCLPAGDAQLQGAWLPSCLMPFTVLSYAALCACIAEHHPAPSPPLCRRTTVAQQILTENPVDTGGVAKYCLYLVTQVWTKTETVPF